MFGKVGMVGCENLAKINSFGIIKKSDGEDKSEKSETQKN